MESKNYIVMFGLPYFPCGMLVCGRQGGLYAMFKVKKRKTVNIEMAPAGMYHVLLMNKRRK